MMKSKIINFGFLCILGLSGSVVYADENYWGAGVGMFDYSEEGIDSDASLTALFGRLGTQFNENFSGEIRAGFGIGDDSINVLSTDVNVELDSMFGGYIRGGVPVSENFYPYAILGYTRGEISVSVPGFSDSESESDVSFGIGADFGLGESTKFNIEYINYLDKEGAEVSGFSIGIVRPF